MGNDAPEVGGSGGLRRHAALGSTVWSCGVEELGEADSSIACTWYSEGWSRLVAGGFQLTHLEEETALGFFHAKDHRAVRWVHCSFLSSEAEPALPGSVS